MNKRDCLRNLSDSRFFPMLANGEMKLYILLLAWASEIGEPCAMNLKQIEKVTGKMPSLPKLKSTMAALEKYELVKFEAIEDWPHGNLRFRLKQFPAGKK